MDLFTEAEQDEITLALFYAEACAPMASCTGEARLLLIAKLAGLLGFELTAEIDGNDSSVGGAIKLKGPGL
jgi:hypothetical protein